MFSQGPDVTTEQGQRHLMSCEQGHSNLRLSLSRATCLELPFWFQDLMKQLRPL